MSGERLTEEVKDLYKLLGNYERFTQDVDSKITSIQNQNGEILEKVNTIEKNCPVQTQRITENEKDIVELTKHGVPKRTKTQINVNTVISAINGLILVIKTWMGV